MLLPARRFDSFAVAAAGAGAGTLRSLLLRPVLGFVAPQLGSPAYKGSLTTLMIVLRQLAQEATETAELGLYLWFWQQSLCSSNC